MKNYILIALLTVAAGLVTITKLAKGSYSGPQTLKAEFHVTDIPEQGIVGITPSNAEFDSLVASSLKDGGPILQTLKPFAVLIKNTSTRTVVAYSLKWELTRDDGKIATQTRSYITLWKLMGMKGSNNDGAIIPANSFAFVTPSNLDFSEAAVVNGKDQNLLDQASNARAELMNYTKIGLAIDGVFFEDGTYAGSDSTGFFSMVETLRNAKRDLYLEINEGLKHGKPAKEVLQRVEGVASEPKIGSSSELTSDELYRKYKRDAATELVRMRSHSGDTKVIEFVSSLLKNRWPELRKL